jgi:hypothetical protein
MGSQPTATIASAANNPPLSKQEVLACMPAFCLRMGSVVQKDYLAGKPPAQSSRGRHNATRERKLCAFASLWVSIRLLNGYNRECPFAFLCCFGGSFKPVRSPAHSRAFHLLDQPLNPALPLRRFLRRVLGHRIAQLVAVLDDRRELAEPLQRVRPERRNDVLGAPALPAVRAICDLIAILRAPKSNDALAAKPIPP